VSTAANVPDLKAAFATLARESIDALVVGASVYFANQRETLVDLAARHRIPAMYELRSFVEAGGLVSYSASLTDAFRQVGIYAGKILSGAKPADLPVQQPTKFELVMNLKTAKVLDLEIPPTLLARADEVIE
jgi:putative ABC transport system substrate-binding protein